jgi:hypothetical protein
MTGPVRYVRISVHDGKIDTSSNVGDEAALAMLEVAKSMVLDRICGRAPSQAQPVSNDHPSTATSPAIGLARTVA